MSADMASDKDKKTTAAQAKPAAAPKTVKARAKPAAKPQPQTRASSPVSAKPEPTSFSRRRVWPD